MNFLVETIYDDLERHVKDMIQHLVYLKDEDAIVAKRIELLILAKFNERVAVQVQFPFAEDAVRVYLNNHRVFKAKINKEALIKNDRSYQFGL
jgi:hypothetical protein